MLRAPRSEISPYRDDESASARHWRRKRDAEDHEQTLREYVASRGGRMRVLSRGGHWQVAIDGSLIEWWPHTWRLVFDKRYSRPRKAHDVQQVITQIDRRR